MTLGRFFDDLSDGYDDSIERCVPRYREVLDCLVGYLPPGFEARRVLELGPGSGNLTALLASRFPRAELHLVDLSAAMLARCRERFGDRVVLHETGFLDVAFDDASLDLVASSIALHHLDHEGKRELFRRLARWIRPGGVLVYADQFTGAAPWIGEEHHRRWEAATRACGTDDGEWEIWMRHEDEHDHHASLPDQLRWLEAAGFDPADCVWRHLLWTVVVAARPDATP